MSERLAEYLDAHGAAAALREIGAEMGATEFVRVRNLDYVPARYEIYPLAPRVRPPLERIVAFAVDMDGTSTTTEPLALHALEYMVRRFTGLLTEEQWAGLDERLDHPYVIGNSNFRHTEFLVERYRDRLDRAALRQAFFEALVWTLANMEDPQRRRDVLQTARMCGLGDVPDDPEVRSLVRGGGVDDRNVGRLVEPIVGRYGSAFRAEQTSELVSAALDVYYMRYHSILRRMERGEGESLARELLGEGGRRLAEPMPGYDVFLALVKGWLGPEADGLFDMLRAAMLDGRDTRHSAGEIDSFRPRLVRLAERFRRRPARIALVTASIAYETHAVMKEVIRVIERRVRDWPVPSDCRNRLAERLADYRAVYDGFVCASDACETRLKPHRDLYSLALYQMSIPRTQYVRCVGLEDTEPGIIALRAAGIGCAIALPNRDTSRQDYRAAVEVIRGGLPELIVARNLLLNEEG